MRSELDEALVKDFPNLYRNRHADMQSTAMCWGFECGDGWEPLIRELSAKLEALILEIPYEDDFQTIDYRSLFETEEEMIAALARRPWIRQNPTWNEDAKTYVMNRATPICASQVKEKWGTLRFYMTSGTDAMWDLIHEAENNSATICEVCGSAGVTRDGGWVRTLCDEHAET